MFKSRLTSSSLDDVNSIVGWPMRQAESEVAGCVERIVFGITCSRRSRDVGGVPKDRIAIRGF